MKAARFGYHLVDSVPEALSWLEAYDGTARVLAGGQSLVPMMNMRLVRPDALVDINNVPGLADIERTATGVRIGAMVRYRALEDSALVGLELPLISRAVRHIGDRQVRNRGTIGGSLVQGDPTGEIPLACLTLEARVTVLGPEGTREISVADLYEDSYATVLRPGELLIAVDFPHLGQQAAFTERCRRHNDFAVLSVAASGRRSADGRWSGVRVGMGGVASTPVLLPLDPVRPAAAATGYHSTTSKDDASRSIELDDATIAEIADRAVAVAEPASDIRASAEYRRHLIPVYVRRTLTELRNQGVA
jgi:aerobic carbon-monoxide dehydrogenase medium subunit